MSIAVRKERSEPSSESESMTMISEGVLTGDAVFDDRRDGPRGVEVWEEDASVRRARVLGVPRAILHRYRPVPAEDVTSYGKRELCTDDGHDRAA